MGSRKGTGRPCLQGPGPLGHNSLEVRDYISVVGNGDSSTLLLFPREKSKTPPASPLLLERQVLCSSSLPFNPHPTGQSRPRTASPEPQASPLSPAPAGNQRTACHWPRLFAALIVHSGQRPALCPGDTRTLADKDKMSNSLCAALCQSPTRYRLRGRAREVDRELVGDKLARGCIN
jgi:hypothetical protein